MGILGKNELQPYRSRLYTLWIVLQSVKTYLEAHKTKGAKDGNRMVI